MFRRAAKLLAFGLVAVAGIYFLRSLSQHLSEIPPIQWSVPAVAAGLASVLAVLTTVALIGLMWQLLLRDQNAKASTAKVMQIISIAQIGKYLPGNVGHFAGRTVLGNAAGIPTGIIVSTMLIETLWTVAVGAGLSLVAITQFLASSGADWVPPVTGTQLAAGAVLLLTLPSIGLKLMNRFAPKVSLWLGGGKPVLEPRFKTALMVTALMLLCFFLLGGALHLQAKWIFGASESSLIAVTTLFTAAWLMGYLIPGAPGGLGVREAMMVVLLAPLYGTGVAAGLGLTMRLVTITADGLALLIGLGSKKFI